MKKKMICAICAATLIIGTAFTAYASGEINSQGRISFVGLDDTAGTSDDVVFDASDFDTLISLSNEKLAVLSTAIEAKGGTVHDENPGTSDIITGIDSIPTTITQDDFTDCDLIYLYHHHTTDSTSADSTSTDAGPYEDSYISPTSGGCYTTVVYKAHAHTSSCYAPYYSWDEWCYGDVEEHTSPGGDLQYTCNSCGQWLSGPGAHTKEGGSGWSYPSYAINVRTTSKLRCGKVPGTRYADEGVEGYTRSCGKTECEMTGAEITFR